MLKISCIAKNTQLKDDLKDLIQYVAYNRIAQSKDAGIGSIYNEIRNSGIEIDIQSVGALYNEVLPKTYKQISSDKEVTDFALKSYTDSIERASKLEEKVGENQVGKDATEIHVVNGIMNMFTNAFAADSKTNSDMLVMQKALWNAIQRKLGKPKQSQPTTKATWQDNISQALGYEQLGIRDLNGRLNGINDLYNAMKQQLNEASKEMRAKGDAATVDRWNEMVKQLEASTYSLLFSTKEAKDTLNGLMKEAGFAKKLKNGETNLDWAKLAGEINSVQDVRNNVQRVLEDAGYSAQVIEGIKNSLENEFNQFHANLLEHNLGELNRRNNAIDREMSSKSDLKRLAELNNYGIFNNTHDRVLYNLIGVDDLQQQDIQDLKLLAQAASDLFREVDKNYGSDVFASFAFQNLQTGINSIVSRNIKNKTGLLKVFKVIENIFGVYLTSLLGSVFNIAENALSGIKGVFVANRFNKLSKEDRLIYQSVISDVFSRGIPFGEEVGSFAPRDNFLNNLKWKWDNNASKSDKSKSLLYILSIPARVGLVGLDSANKAVSTNKIFHHAVYKALTQTGKSELEATKIINEALYGQKFDDAKKTANDLLQLTNAKLPEKYKTPINEATLTRLANDLVKANLVLGGKIDSDFIEAAIKGSYHVAGLGLGHDPNNFFSSSIKGLRDKRAKKEAQIVKDKEWGELAWHKAQDIVLNNFVIKFAAGGANWIVLKLEYDLGIGLVSGFMGRWNRDIDFKNKESIRKSILEREGARDKIGRTMIGLTSTALAYALGMLLTGSGLDDEEKRRLAELKAKKESGWLSKYQKDNLSTEKRNNIKSKLEGELSSLEEKGNVFMRIKGGDYLKRKAFLKLAPSIMLAQYYSNTNDDQLMAALQFGSQILNTRNDYSAAGKFNDAIALLYKKDKDAALGKLGSIIGDSFGVPMWRQYKDYWRMGTWAFGQEVNSDYKNPTNWSEGVWGGGAAEDFGLFKRDSKITLLPGIGAAKYELFKEKGIESMSDLAKTPDWFNMKHKSESGEMVPILTATEKKKAKEAWEKYEASK